ncbi:hypothetical protein H9P43_009273 [Blastocladiella emersonii ATCC 22665]|nr:hypothetical protein H9P43_009273 [Blastocladiella emersonii ATCC 22665]
MNTPGLGAKKSRSRPKPKKARGGRKAANAVGGNKSSASGRGGQKAAESRAYDGDDDSVSELGLIQFFFDGIEPDVDPNLHGFVARCLEPYADESGWDRAFAPLDHVDENIWAELAEPFLPREFFLAADEAVERGDTDADILANLDDEQVEHMVYYLDESLRRGILPLSPAYEAGSDGGDDGSFSQTVAMVLATMLRDRILSVVANNDVLLGVQELDVARSRSTVVDAVLQIVAERACMAENDGRKRDNKIWGKFMNVTQFMYDVPHDLFIRAMRRVKIPPKFIDFFLKALLPVLDPEAARTRVGVPLGELASEMLWAIFYDVALCEIHRIAIEVVAARGQV